MSWLASYVHNFGPIEAEAFKHLTLASSIAARLETDLPGLNHWAENLIQLSQLQSKTSLPSSIDRYVNEQVKPDSTLIAESPQVLIQKIRDLLKITSSREVNLLSSKELEKVFEGSVSLGFTLWQHLAAVERLSGLPDWQVKNQSLWKKLSAGQTLCGIPESILNKVGQRGFSYQKEGRGNGLGVSFAKETIEKYAGQFKITSKVGSGTSILMSLPQSMNPRN